MRNNDLSAKMKLPRGHTGALLIVPVLLMCFGALLSCSDHEQAGTKKGVETGQESPLSNIREYRLGMGIGEVKRMLRENNIKDYRTQFSDLLVYDPSPGAEIKLRFACGPREYMLTEVDLITASIGNSEQTLSDFKKKLTAEYGEPAVARSGHERMNFCWGACGQGESGMKLSAEITMPDAGNSSLVLTRTNDILFEICNKICAEKTNKWLYQWIAVVQKFNPGITLEAASKLYQQRYHNLLVTSKEQDDTDRKDHELYYIAKDYDFFAGLDYDSESFQGAGPGTILLKFTGDQTGRNDLDKRLYFASFATTKFSDKHIYTDIQEKLNRFIKAYGSPNEIVRQPHVVTAGWSKGAKKLSVSISDTGLITTEQSDHLIEDTYRKTVEMNSGVNERKP